MVDTAVLQGIWSGIGIILATASAASTVVGMLLQKQGLESGSKALYRVGIFTFAVVKPVTQIAALYAAPLSLVAPLASLTILLNAVIVPYFQGAKIDRTAVIAGIMLACGCAGTSLAGAHGSPSWTYSKLLALGMQSRFLSSFLFGVLMMLSLILRFVRDSLRGKAIGILLVAALPSVAAALNNVMLKVLLNSVMTAPPIPILVITGTVAITAFLQVWSTALGVEIFDLLIFVPLQISAQIVITTLYSISFFDEEPGHALAFELSLALILSGVLITLCRRSLSLFTDPFCPRSESSEGYQDIDGTAHDDQQQFASEGLNSWDPGPWGRQVTK